jgi:hypothetical protein
VLRAGVVDFRPVDAGRLGRTNDAFERCVTETFCELRFPSRPGAEVVRVSYPLHLDWAF